ncbi:hypothetical protein ACG0Z6_14920 [Roseateles sp. BYS180W]|uniref:Uncharacterized protein n=1 Tax=Roseateles rivi TaxID=3299028 RepID=A0ABW7FYU4_9BURK
MSNRTSHGGTSRPLALMRQSQGGEAPFIAWSHKKEPVPAIRFVFALLLGYLVQESLVFAAGVSAAIATPAGYFEYFGRRNVELALGLWGVASFAMPIFLLALLQAWLAIRIFRLRRALAFAFFLGVLLCWLRYMLEVPTPDLNTTQLASPQQFWALLCDIYLSNPWSLPSTWAPWLGLLTGAYLGGKNSNAAPSYRNWA